MFFGISFHSLNQCSLYSVSIIVFLTANEKDNAKITGIWNDEMQSRNNSLHVTDVHCSRLYVVSNVAKVFCFIHIET